MNTPRVIRLNGEDNVVIAIDLVNQGDPAHGLTARQRIHKGHKMAIAADPRGRAGPQVRPDHRLRERATSRPANGCTSTTSGCTISRATTASPRTRKTTSLLPEDMRATFEGYRRAERQGRHAQLHRHPHQRELLGVGRALHRARRSSAPACSPTIPKSTASSRSCTAPAAAMAAYGEGFEVLRRTQWGYASHPNFAGVADGRPRLRGVPDRPHEEGIRARPRATPSAP